jgi:diaminopimelate epimerase
MHALGNDFVVLDIREAEVDDLPAMSRWLCNRRFGVGADQVLLLENSEKADYRMLIYNADGSEVEMCGNGIRALTKYIWDRGLSDRDTLEIETLAGIIKPKREGDLIRVDMGVPELDGIKIPTNMEGRIIDQPMKVIDREFLVTCVSMGNPHAVIFVNDLERCPVHKYGPEIENRTTVFPKRINVEFADVISRDEIKMRVWERGAGETLACGTGACATAVAAMLKDMCDNSVTVHLRGGDLIIEWDGEGQSVFMTGPATTVFEGELSNN